MKSLTLESEGRVNRLMNVKWALIRRKKAKEVKDTRQRRKV